MIEKERNKSDQGKPRTRKGHKPQAKTRNRKQQNNSSRQKQNDFRT